ncbi:MAG TPA: HAD-IA family hydrolase [Candidatus Hydrogenedentes bacterium]|nr:HAD-IA family hydrolase [Candidatus Hydrogenedentota bacterium]HPG68763.1 HAD-IA family hydrolase [Candidatus Hydrogenedentota bacterium]
MPDHRSRAVVFDFDYTLGDSSEGIVLCMNSALESLGFSPKSPEAICKTIGLSLDATFEALTGLGDGETRRAFTKAYIRRADEILERHIVIFPAVPGALRQLRAHGCALGIVSTKFRYRIQPVLERDGLLDAFGVVIGGEDVAEFKPAPEGLLKAIETLGATPAEAVYVGDSVTDVETAARAGVRCLIVLSGVTPREAFHGRPVWAVLNDVAEVPAFIENHL